MLIQTKNDELRSSNRDVEVLERRLLDLENRLIMSQQENDRLKGLTEERSSELEGWK